MFNEIVGHHPGKGVCPECPVSRPFAMQLTAFNFTFICVLTGVSAADCLLVQNHNRPCATCEVL